VLDTGLGFSLAAPHSEFCENTSRYLIAEKLEEAQPRVKHGATAALESIDVIRKHRKVVARRHRAINLQYSGKQSVTFNKGEFKLRNQV
jgi:hypothetical protein